MSRKQTSDHRNSIPIFFYKQIPLKMNSETFFGHFNMVVWLMLSIKMLSSNFKGRLVKHLLGLKPIW